MKTVIFNLSLIIIATLISCNYENEDLKFQQYLKEVNIKMETPEQYLIIKFVREKANSYIFITDSMTEVFDNSPYNIENRIKKNVRKINIDSLTKSINDFEASSVQPCKNFSGVQYHICYKMKGRKEVNKTYIGNCDGHFISFNNLMYKITKLSSSIENPLFFSVERKSNNDFNVFKVNNFYSDSTVLVTKINRLKFKNGRLPISFNEYNSSYDKVIYLGIVIDYSFNGIIDSTNLFIRKHESRYTFLPENNNFVFINNI